MIAVMGLSTISTLIYAPPTSADVAAFAAQNDKYYAGIFLRDCLAQMNDKKREILVSSTTDLSLLFTDPNQEGVPTFRNNTVQIGRHMQPDNGTANCNDANMVNRAISAMGYSSASAFLVGIGYTQSTITRQSCTVIANVGLTCTNTQVPAYVAPNGDTIASKLTSQSSVARYVLYSTIFAAQCPPANPPAEGTTATMRYAAEEPAGSGKYVAKEKQVVFATGGSTVGGGVGGGAVVTPGQNVAEKSIPRFDYNGRTITCRGLLTEMNGLINAVVTYNNNNPDDAITDEKIQDKNEAEATTCAIEGIGWIVCPISRGLAGFAEFSFRILSNFLRVPALTVTPNTGLFGAWQTMRNIANVILVIVFIIIIYSQIVGGGGKR